MKTTTISNSKFRRKSIVAFLIFAGCFAIAVFFWGKIKNAKQQNGTPAPLRTALETNESIFYGLFGNKLTQTYPASMAAKKVRVNGNIGMRTDFEPENWKLQVIRKPGDTIFISLEEIRSLPKTEIIFDFKCIEGWDQISHWGGVRFSDFIKKYKLDEQAAKQFTGLVTPDGGYYVGIDNKSMMHPQTLLCYELNDKPLPMNQGYPLRLIIPVKYGVKHIKRIGSIFFSNIRPPDYWHERGYDYYCGL
jgi:hypothetical protein